MVRNFYCLEEGHFGNHSLATQARFYPLWDSVILFYDPMFMSQKYKKGDGDTLNITVFETYENTDFTEYFIQVENDTDSSSKAGLWQLLCF